MSKRKDADLILKLYDLRREAVMRQGRNWFFAFNPTSAQDFVDAMLGENSAYFRMVVSYWDMAASLVNNGAIDQEMFQDANGEHLFVYSKVEPFLEEVRAKLGSPRFLAQLEKLIDRIPDGKEQTAVLRERMKQFAAIREQREAKVAGAN